MKTKLVVKSGAKHASLNLRLPAVIGRSSASDVKVQHHHISRRHCEIFEDDGELVVRDLESSNGTYVNGIRIEAEVVLAPGDELKLGSVVFGVSFRPRKSAAEEAKADPTAQTVDDISSAATLHYEESDLGSFVGIEFDETIPDSVQSAPSIECDAVESVGESRIDLDVGETTPEVDSDPHLRDFLDGIQE